MITWQIRFTRWGEGFFRYFEAEEGLEYDAAEVEANAMVIEANSREARSVFFKADLIKSVRVVEYDTKTNKKKRGGRDFWLTLAKVSIFGPDAELRTVERYHAERKWPVGVFVEGTAGGDIKENQLVEKREDGKFYGVKN